MRCTGCKTGANRGYEPVLFLCFPLVSSRISHPTCQTTSDIIKQEADEAMEDAASPGHADLPRSTRQS
jgi:hypothetical protein